MNTYATAAWLCWVKIYSVDAAADAPSVVKEQAVAETGAAAAWDLPGEEMLSLPVVAAGLFSERVFV